MADKLADVQGKVAAYRIVFVGLTNESLDGDREIKRRSAQHDDKTVVNFAV